MYRARMKRSPQVPAYQDLADALRLRIVSGELEPGDRLPVEPELCAEYAVSRSTVREALRVLSSQGLVVTTRGVTGGTFVAHPDGDQISEYLETSLGLLVQSDAAGISVRSLLEVRSFLEVPAAGLAAQHRTEAQLEALRDTLIDPRRVDAAEIGPTNIGFHALLLEASSNPLLSVVTQPVFRMVSRRFARDDAPKRFWAKVFNDHREIFYYVEAGDAEGAQEATAEHLGHLRTTYEHIDRERRDGRGEIRATLR
ncbi:MAG: FCD domain-containing protein [Streptosporangiales bacterium]|nr:FCD domain-containing protein [Streptosporangiales bacterium]